MTFVQRRNRLTTHFSKRIPVVKRRKSVLGRVGRSDDRITVKFMERGCWVLEGTVTTRTVITDGLRHSTSRAAALLLATLMLEWFRSTTLTQVITDYCKSSQLILLELAFTFSTTDSTLTELKSSPSRMHSESHSCSSNASEGNQNVHKHTGAALRELIISLHVHIQFYHVQHIFNLHQKTPMFSPSLVQTKQVEDGVRMSHKHEKKYWPGGTNGKQYQQGFKSIVFCVMTPRSFCGRSSIILRTNCLHFQGTSAVVSPLLQPHELWLWSRFAQLTLTSVLCVKVLDRPIRNFAG
jgi:hypothetical protein